MQPPTKSTLFYFHDPMCSWCWGFRPTLLDLQSRLPDDIAFQSVLGGLAPDSDEPMPSGMQKMLQSTWQRIHHTLGTEFNFDFWQHCRPRRSTYPACRAVIIARAEGLEAEMVQAIQQAYYLQARNPSDLQTLTSLAKELELDGEKFYRALTSPEVDKELQEEINFTRTCGVSGFPALALEINNSVQLLELSYEDADFMLSQIVQRLKDS